MPAQRNMWTIGRRFQLSAGQPEFHGATYILTPGHTWMMEAFGRMRHEETGIVARTSPIERAAFLPRIQMLDGVSKALKKLIEQAPDAKCVRGYVRTEIGTVPKKSDTPTTTEGWLKFIASVKSQPPPPEAPPPPAQTYSVRVRANRREDGRCNYSGVRVFDVRYEVPRDVVSRGAAAIRTYVMGLLEADEGGILHTDETDQHDPEAEGEIEIRESNINSVVEAHRTGGVPTAAPAGVPLVRDTGTGTETIAAPTTVYWATTT